MTGVCAEFSDYMSKRPKQREVFIDRVVKFKGDPSKKNGGGGPSGAPRKPAPRPASDFMKDDKKRRGSGGDRGGRSNDNNNYSKRRDRSFSPDDPKCCRNRSAS